MEEQEAGGRGIRPMAIDDGDVVPSRLARNLQAAT